MSDEFTVDPDQLTRHAAAVEAVKARFGAVKGASGAISGDSAAYGILCGWIAGVLEGRHTSQNELYSYVEENLSLAAQSLRSTSADYLATDEEIGQDIKAAGGL